MDGNKNNPEKKPEDSSPTKTGMTAGEFANIALESWKALDANRDGRLDHLEIQRGQQDTGFTGPQKQCATLLDRYYDSLDGSSPSNFLYQSDINRFRDFSSTGTRHNEHAMTQGFWYGNAVGTSIGLAIGIKLAKPFLLRNNGLAYAATLMGAGVLGGITGMELGKRIFDNASLKQYSSESVNQKTTAEDALRLYSY